MLALATSLVLLMGIGSGPIPTAAASRLQVVYESGTLEGTCALVYADQQDDEAVLYLVTSMRLFTTAHGDRFAPALAVRVLLDDRQSLVIPREGVLLPTGNLVDVALLRVTVPFAPPVPHPLSRETPEVGALFDLAGFTDRGALDTVDERVRFESTRVIVGDRDASQLSGCLGAPAIGADGVFGIVSDCEPHRAPTITLLSMAYPFLARHLPGFGVSSTLRHER